jgi:acyl-coenzyme A thioesterase PaaI-like protein
LIPQSAIDAIPYAEQLGIKLHDTLDSGFVFKLEPESRFMGNPAIEAFHGGIICGLMDCAMTVTIMCVLEKAEPPSIINQTTSYLGSASLQSPVYVRAEITKPGRRIVGAYARAYQDNEVHLVAKCSSLFKLVERLRQ